MEMKKKISEENVFTKDHVNLLKDVIKGCELTVTRISGDDRLTDNEKVAKLNVVKEQIEKATEILNNSDLLESYIKFCTISDIDMFASHLFTRTGLGVINKPISIGTINEAALKSEISMWNLDEKDLIEFLRNKSTFTVIEELYQKAGYKMSDSRFNSSDGFEFFETLGYSSIPQVYDAITRLSDKYVPESIDSNSKGL